MGTAGLVLGILAVIIVFIPGMGMAGPIVGIVGIILSALARKKANELGQHDNMATAGLVLSIIGTVLSLIFYIACVALIAGTGAALNSFHL